MLSFRAHNQDMIVVDGLIVVVYLVKYPQDSISFGGSKATWQSFDLIVVYFVVWTEKAPAHWSF